MRPLLALWAGLLLGAPLPAAAQLSGTMDFYVTPSVPASPPQPVADLQLSSTPFEGQVRLDWTAPDGYTPPVGEIAGAYLIRYATFSLLEAGNSTTSWWNSATAVSANPPVMAVPGSTQSLTIDGMTPGATLWFSIRSTSAVNPALLSPIDTQALASAGNVRVIVPDLPPPAPGGVFITTLPAQGRIQWVYIATSAVFVNTATTWDFNFFRVYQSSVSGSGPYTELTPSTGTRGTTHTTPAGLVGFNTYYYQIRSVDNHLNESTNAATVSFIPYPIPGPLSNLAVAGSTFTPTLIVSWLNPTDPDAFASFKGGILVGSEGGGLNGSPTQLSNVTVVGSTVGSNGTVLESWGNGINPNGSPKTQYIHQQLTAGNTYFYTAIAFYRELLNNGTTIYTYSSAISTGIVLADRAMPPAGVVFDLDTLGLPLIRWEPVTHRANGVLMPVSTTTFKPEPKDLDGYNVYRSTCGAAGCGGNAGWGSPLNGSSHVQGSSFTVSVISGKTNYFIVRAVNNFNFESDDSNTVDDSRALYAVAKDETGNAVAQIQVPNEAANELDSSENGDTVDYRLEAVVRDEEVIGNVRRSLDLRVVKGDDGSIIDNFAFKNAQFVLAMSAQSLNNTLNFSAAANPNLDIYRWNGVRWLPMFGDVNAETETVTVRTSATGLFQLRDTTRTNAFAFDPAAHLLPRVITPNDDGLNDTMFFITNIAGVKGKVFDIRGGKVGDLTEGPPCPSGVSNCLYWDGKAAGKPVHSGIYIYDLEGGGKHFTGTCVVSR